VDPFVGQLARLCAAHPTRSKWVFVPSHAIGRTLGERLALDGTNWLNLRFVTPLDIALRMGAPFLVERGVDPSAEELGPALVMRLLLDLPRDGGYFRPLADQPTMAQALWATIRELRMAGIEASDLTPQAFQSATKHQELRALLGAYEKFLVTTSRADMAVVYEEALRHPDWCPIQPQDCWTELPDTVWTSLQRRLLDAMPGERISPAAVLLPRVTFPRRLGVGAARVPPRESGRMQPCLTDNPLAFLMQPPTAIRQAIPATRVADAEVGVRHNDAIRLFHAGGREAEIEEVFRRILSAGVSIDQVEIACASDAHVALVWEKALRHDWAVTLGPGIPATQTRPGRALIGLCDWIETDFSGAHLRRLLQSGDLGVDADVEGFTPGQAAGLLARAEAGWGRATYALSLGHLRKSYESRATDPDRSDDDRADASAKAETTSRVLAWIAGIIAAIPEADADGNVPLQLVVNGALGFVERTTARKSALDNRAATALLEYIGELRALGAFGCSLSGALRFIRERVQSLHVASERPRPGHLYACTLAQAGYSGRPHLFVAGLEEGRVFPSAAEDPVLLDAERAAISPALRRSTDKIDEAVYTVLSRLAAWGRAPASDLRAPGSLASTAEEATADANRSIPSSVTFSYSCRDTREFRDTYASWLMLQAFRLQRGDAALSYQDMKRSLGEPTSIIASERQTAPSSAGWWLRSVVGTGADGVSAVGSAFSDTARGLVAEQQRASDAFSEFDGCVVEAGAILDPCAEGTSLSVTELENAAACPFRFFLKRGLGIRALDDGERDKDVWLDPMTRGSELHDVYASMLRRSRQENRRPDKKKDGTWLRDLAEARLTELRQQMPPATTEIFHRESKDFLADVELFLEAECENGTSTPIGFEVSFGRPLEDHLEPLARAEAVEIDLGGGLTFRIAGRIDRIDQVGPSSFEVLDYKTGGFWRDNWKGTFNGGRRLQHALYGLAAVELLRSRYSNPTITAGVYYFPSRKGQRNRVRINAPGRLAIAAVLADLRELIVNGAFAHAQEEEDCKFCDYSTACDGTLKDRAENKLKDSRLQAYGRLAAHV
jgi:RecB family exonuclease